MAHLSLFLLGAFQATLDGEQITGFESVKARALLAFLAVEADRPHRRESLAGLLWPNRPDSPARTNLRHTLSALRTVIGDRDTAPPFLSITRETIQFNKASDYWLDVEAFRALTEANPEDRSTIRPLQEAVALYRGSFLEGFSAGDSPAFEDWSLLTRERLERQASAVLRRLIGEHEEYGELEQAREFAWRRVELEPWQEEAHQCLMRLLALSGHRSAALAQYGTCCQILAEELNVEPTEETMRLYEQILDGELAAQKSETKEPKSPGFPVPLTPLIGRETELAKIGECLQDPNCRLLTLVGPGGSGKTHLALVAAAEQTSRFGHGVYFVSLASLQAVDAIVPTIAQALDFSFYDEREPREQLFGYLYQRNMLLVLDSFEHLLDGAALVTDILEQAPDVTLLATSHARLNVQDEYCFHIAGLDVPQLEPSAFANAVQFSAVKLFLFNARRARLGFELADENLPDVVRICRLVDGMPLGILLASAWVEMLPPAEIAHEIATHLPGHGLDFLETDLRDVPARQRSMRAVFDHSWGLLAAQEQKRLAKLSAFQGSYTSEAAHQITGAALHELRALVTKSLLHRTPTGQYEMHELLRQYAAQKLNTSRGVERSVRDRYCAYYCAALRDWEADLKSSRQQTALAQMDAEIKNVRAAWDWAAQHEYLEQLDQAAESLGLFYLWRFRGKEGESAFREAAERLTITGEQLPAHKLRVLAKVLAWQSRFSDAELASQLLKQGKALLEKPQLADQNALQERAFVSILVGWRELDINRKRARQSFEQGLRLCQASGDHWYEANALSGLGQIAWHWGEYDQARQLVEQSLMIRQTIRDPRGIADSHDWLGTIALGEGQFEEAQALMRESIALRKRIGDRAGVARGYQMLGLTLGLSGKPDALRSLLEDSVTIWSDLGARTALPFATVLLAAAKMFSGEYEQARTEVQTALSLALETSDPYASSHARLLLGAIALAQEAYAEADRWFQESLTSFKEIGQQTEIGVAFGFLGCAARGLGDLDRAEQLFFKALRTAVKIRSFLPAMPALPGAALLLADRGEEERAIELYALLSHYPAITDMPWSADIAGRHITAVAASLPPKAVAAAKERGRNRDPEAAVAELFIELAAARSLPKPLSLLGKPLARALKPLLMAVLGGKRQRRTKAKP